MSSIATSEFVDLLLQHSEPTIRYARLVNNFDPDEVFCLWSEMEGLELSVQNQRILLATAGQELSADLALRYYPQYRSIDSDFVMVSQKIDYLLPGWYRMMHHLAEVDHLNQAQWLSLIWRPLMALIRAYARFFGKTWQTMSHGNILGGFAFVYSDDNPDEFVEVLIHHFGEGTILHDLELFWRVIVVIVCRLDPELFLSTEALMTVDHAANEVPVASLQEYVEKVQDACFGIENNPLFFDQKCLSFLLEDPLIWTPYEKMLFLKRFTYHVFKVCSPADRDNILSYCRALVGVDLGNLEFWCPAFQGVFDYFQDGYVARGHIIKIVRNIVFHYSQEYRDHYGQHLTGFQEAYLHDMAEYAIEIAVGTTMTSYAFEGLCSYLDDVHADLDDKVDLIHDIEFRVGFPGYEAEFEFHLYDYWGQGEEEENVVAGDEEDAGNEEDSDNGEESD